MKNASGNQTQNWKTEKKIRKGKCSMCGNTFIYFEEGPPGEFYFLAKKYHGNLCWNCALRILNYIRSFREQRKWKTIVG